MYSQSPMLLQSGCKNDNPYFMSDFMSRFQSEDDSDGGASAITARRWWGWSGNTQTAETWVLSVTPAPPSSATSDESNTAAGVAIRTCFSSFASRR